MGGQANPGPAFVIRAEELTAVNYIAASHPRPQSVEWINRGTNQILRPTTTDMLLRTLFQPTDSPSVQRLHETAGLRIVFRSESDRVRFASEFEAALRREQAAREHVVTAIFDDRERAEAAIADLCAGGFPRQSISLLCRASHFSDPEAKWPEGHRTLDITGVIAGSGVAGALLGLAVLLVPGVGAVAAAGAITGSAISSIASISGIIGATGGAIAKMLTDHDVDGVSAAFYDRQIQRGKVFVSVDVMHPDADRARAREILDAHGGRTPPG